MGSPAFETWGWEGQRPLPGVPWGLFLDRWGESSTQDHTWLCPRWEPGASGLRQEGVWAQACFLEDVLTQARSSRASCPHRVPVFPIDIPGMWRSQAVTGLTSSSGSQGWWQSCIQMPSAQQLDAGGRGVLTRLAGAGTTGVQLRLQREHLPPGKSEEKIEAGHGGTESVDKEYSLLLSPSTLTPHSLVPSFS